MATRCPSPTSLDNLTPGRSLKPALPAAVMLNEEKVAIHEDQNELEIIPYVEKGEFLILWQKHRPGLGNAVELTTGELPMLLDEPRAGAVQSCAPVPAPLLYGGILNGLYRCLGEGCTSAST